MLDTLVRFRHHPSMLAIGLQPRGVRNLRSVGLWLVLGCAVALSGCSTMTKMVQLPLDPLPITSRQFLQQTNGLNLAVGPLCDGAEVKQLFGADFLAANLETNVLLVFVAATNRNEATTFLISPQQFALLDNRGQLAGAAVTERTVHETTVLGATVAWIGILTGPAGLALLAAPSAQMNAERVRNALVINQNLRYQALSLKTLPPGAATHGYVYFPVSRALPHQSTWTIIFKSKTLGAEGEKEIPFSFQW